MRTLLLMVVLLITSCFVFLGCVTTGSQKPPKNVRLVEFKAPMIGTEVEWKVINDGEESNNYSTFVKEEIDGISSYYWKNSEQDDANIYDLESMNFLGLWSHKNKEWLQRIKPNNGNKQYPLWAGKKYRSGYFFSEKNGWSGHVDSWVKIEDWEKVTVPAGTFDTLRIAQRNKNFSFTHWFSPELGMAVKFKITNRRGNRSGELIKIVVP